MSDHWTPDKMVNGKLAVKPMKYLRRKPSIKTLAKSHRTGYLTDHGGKHEVRLDWKLNKVAHRDKIFKLTIDEKVVYLDLEELTFYTRVMFEK